MMNLIGGTDTRQSPSGKLVARMRRYEVNGQVYNLIKNFFNHKFMLTKFRNPDNFLRGVETVFVERRAEWGEGLTWKQAEKIAENTIALREEKHG